MPLFDDIFPSERDERLVQTEWADDWFDTAAGFGYAARCLTEHISELGARIDQAGLAIFFLQRHRVELMLKGLLDAVGANVTYRHDLARAWTQCKAALEPRDPAAWARFAAAHYELVHVLHSVDQSSGTFRYPVDKTGTKVARPAFIDLAVLNTHVDDLYLEASGYMEY